MNAFIGEIYRTGLVQDEIGNNYKLHSNIDRFEGELIYNLIRSDQAVHKTLEIGCAYGISSLHICSALSTRDSARHVIIDPFQYKDWHGVGVSNLKRAGFDFFELIEKPSEVILPELAQNGSGTYDLAFIDGWHTFDHTLLDFFYANLLIRIGGYIVIDDCNFPSIAKVASYITKYPGYRLLSNLGANLHKESFKRRIGYLVRSIIPSSIAGYLIPKHLYDRYYSRVLYPSMIVLKKVEEDKRNWDWFEPF